MAHPNLKVPFVDSTINKQEELEESDYKFFLAKKVHLKGIQNFKMPSEQNGQQVIAKKVFIT